MRKLIGTIAASSLGLLVFGCGHAPKADHALAAARVNRAKAVSEGERLQQKGDPIVGESAAPAAAAPDHPAEPNRSSPPPVR